MPERLKNFQQMWDAYPAPGGPAAEAKRMIGGRVDSDTITNTCVVRISRALNDSGNTVPNRRGDEILTVPGADGRAYALRVHEFTRYMTRRYGQPDLVHVYSDPGGGEVPEAFMGKQGLIIFDVDGWTDASGHVDLWNKDRCRHHGYFNRASKVMLWSVDDTPVAPPLSASVGRGGSNRSEDVIRVQQLLLERGVDPGPVDGVVGERTIRAIQAFQRRFLRAPDGRVDPDGRTWRELLGL